MRVIWLGVWLLLVTLAGCVPYPVYKTLQPSAKVTVQDERGRPVSGANVSLITRRFPYGSEFSRTTKETNLQGIAHFERQSEWQVEALVIHGAWEYSWEWCVSKPGFANSSGPAGNSTQRFSQDAVIRLKRGRATPCVSIDRYLAKPAP